MDSIKVAGVTVTKGLEETLVELGYIKPKDQQDLANEIKRISMTEKIKQLKEQVQIPEHLKADFEKMCELVVEVEMQREKIEANTKLLLEAKDQSKINEGLLKTNELAIQTNERLLQAFSQVDLNLPK